jgi:hypothetical protein
MVNGKGHAVFTLVSETLHCTRTKENFADNFTFCEEVSHRFF